jgi:hypothetical protein
MHSAARYGGTALVAMALALSSAGRQDVKLPNGKSQRDEMLKADHRKNLEDAATLVELTEALKRELEKNDRYVLSVSSLKKTEDIERLAKRIRARLRGGM